MARRTIPPSRGGLPYETFAGTEHLDKRWISTPNEQRVARTSFGTVGKKPNFRGLREVCKISEADLNEYFWYFERTNQKIFAKTWRKPMAKAELAQAQTVRVNLALRQEIKTKKLPNQTEGF
jgi:hypothetical protein